MLLEKIDSLDPRVIFFAWRGALIDIIKQLGYSATLIKNSDKTKVATENNNQRVLLTRKYFELSGKTV